MSEYPRYRPPDEPLWSIGLKVFGYFMAAVIAFFIVAFVIGGGAHLLHYYFPAP